MIYVRNTFKHCVKRKYYFINFVIIINNIGPIMEDDEDVIILSNEYLINPNLPIENHSSRYFRLLH